MQSIKTISSKAVIQRTATMFGIKDNTWHSDAIDWIGEAIQAIGYHCGFETVPIYLKINNYRCNIPSQLESLNYIEYNGHRLSLGIDKSEYGFVNDCNKDIRTIATYNELLELNKEIDRLAVLQDELAVTPNDKDIQNSIIDSNQKITTYVQQFRLAANTQFAREFYNIEGDYIKCSFATGLIKLNAQSFMLDESGYPRVIDTYKYVEAVKWYLIRALCLQGFKHPEIDWKTANVMWDGNGSNEKGFRYQASNEQKMPNIDQMERFSQRWQSVKREAHIQHEVNYI